MGLSSDCGTAPGRDANGSRPARRREEWGPEAPAIERRAGLSAAGGRHLAVMPTEVLAEHVRAKFED